MGLGQTLLTIMATMLLGKVILAINMTTLNAGQMKDMAEYQITATSLGTSVLERTNALAYDQATVASDVMALSSLTTPSHLGPDLPGETADTLYNDIDDYSGYSRTDTISNSAIFKTNVVVEYVKVNGTQIVVSNTQEWSKRVTIRVSSAFMKDTLKFQSIYSYWFFR
jgi:hypothetical protein